MQLIHKSTLVLALFAAGCATPPAPEPPRPDLVWPAPPHPPRIQYVQSVRVPTDLGVQRSRLSRFVNWITGAGEENRLEKPFGIAVDEHGNLCLTDTAANAVFYCDRAHATWRRWDRVGKVAFVAPVAIAKRDGVFFVANSGLNSVLAFNEEGNLLMRITNGLTRPVGLAIHDDALLVVDADQHRVVTFGLDGQYRSAFGRRGTGPGEFNYPTHVATDAEGRMLVTDSMNGRVQVFSPSGAATNAIGGFGDATGFFSRPKGVATDSFGHVYVVDANFDNIQIFDLAGRVLLAFGGAGSEPGRFWLPNGIAIGKDNEIFVADCYNQRVQIFKYVGPP